MADALVSTILDQLVSILRQQAEKEVKLVVGVDKEVKKLESNLGAIQAVLEDAERRSVKDAAVRQWLDKLKDVSCDIDDVLDEWNTAILMLEGDENALKPSGSGKVCSFIPVSYCFRFGEVVRRRDIAVRIKELNETLDEIAVQRDRYSFSLVKGIGEPERNITTSNRMTSSFIDQTMVVGRYEERESLIQMLLTEIGEGPTLRIISIVGMGGIGKTSIAQQVYNDHRVRDHFGKRLWVCVSDLFDKKRVAKAILEELEAPQPNLNELNALLTCISERIRRNKFLLVLDDVWSEDYCEWEQLQNSLQHGSLGSTILVTTRKETVATTTMRSNHWFHLRKLPYEECWDLFSRVAFYGWSSEECGRVKDIGRKIVEKFDGLPLAAKIIGSLLRTKKTRQYWESVSDSEWWKVTKRDLFSFLLLSYHDLSPTMRRCFSYCAIFPKDSEIVKDDIVNLWMAQGYFGAVNSRKMELVGYETFNNLAMHSFFQDFEKDKSGSIRRCKMHDIVHDFAEFLMEKECLKIEVDGPQEPGPELSSHVKARHLTLVLKNGASIPASIYNLKHLRTLMIMDGDKWMNNNVLSQSTCLRVLHLREWSGSIPEEIGKLMNLRYLRLVNCLELKKLPETTCNLFNLQTLIVRGCKSLQKLPDGLEKLVNLQTLDVSGCKSLQKLPDGLEKLVNLQTLDIRRCESLQKLPDGLEKLVNSQTLDVSGCESLQKLPDGLEKLVNLQTLDVKWCKSLQKLPDGLEKLVNLQTLDVSWCKSLQKLPDGLEKLVNLQTLEVIGCKSLQKLPDGLEKLVNLQTLEVSWCKSLQKLPDGLEKLVNLQTLDVSWCKSLQKLPDGLEKLVNLQTLVYSGASPLPKGIGKLTGLQTLDWLPVGNDCDDDEASSSLKDLMNLNQLQGRLCICGLGSERNVIEARKAELQNKKRLISLRLYFSRVGQGAEKEEGRMRNEEQIIEGLQPSSNLEQLRIENYKGILFPVWMTSSLIKLRRIVLSNCPCCVFLPPLGKLPSLEQLSIEGMDGVKRVGTEFLGMESHDHPRGTSSSSSPPRSSPIVLFPKLQGLRFSTLPEWEGWAYSIQMGTRDGVEDAVAAHSTVTIMPRLRALEIQFCQKLKTVPDHLLRSKTLNMDVGDCPNLKHLIEARSRQNYPTQYL